MFVLGGAKGTQSDRSSCVLLSLPKGFMTSQCKALSVPIELITVHVTTREIPSLAAQLWKSCATVGSYVAYAFAERLMILSRCSGRPP